MSDTITEVKEFNEYVKANMTDGVIRREFSAEFTVGDGRTVDVRIVPYGERITHNDGLGGVPAGVDYQEEWLPGVFDHQLNAASRIHANVEHEEGIAGKVGHGIALRSVPGDGVHGTFRLLETQAGETARQLIDAGSLDGVSLEAAPVKNIQRGGVIQRAKANLRAIAFTRFAAYQGARVLALREEPALTIDNDLLPEEIDLELVERCRRLGIKVPQRYTAQPDETDTPALSGTSASGTRQDGEHPDLEEQGDADPV